MAVLRLRGAPKFTAVALSPASLTGLRRGPQKQRATWSLPRKSRVEGVRSGEARRGQRSPGAGREEPGALRSPLASAGARGAPRAPSGPSEPELPPLVSLRDAPGCKGPAPGLGGGRPSRGSAGQGAAAQESPLPAGPAHACWMPVPVGAQRAASPFPHVEIVRPSRGSHPSRRRPVRAAAAPGGIRDAREART